MYVLMTGRWRANDSMMATGSPSAKLGRTSARERRISSRTRSASSQPVMCTLSSRSCSAMSRSMGRRNGPSPTRNQLGLHPLGGEAAHRLDQQEMALLLGEPSDAEQPRLPRYGRAPAPEEARVDAAVDEVDLRPVGAVGPAVELRPAVVADRRHERRAADLRVEGELGRTIGTPPGREWSGCRGCRRPPRRAWRPWRSSRRCDCGGDVRPWPAAARPGRRPPGGRPAARAYPSGPAC